ncbi:UDP-glucose 4-epimerase [Labilithrix luteola]|uniref:UDP-glucose 4-epimerase n=1 Tax=Labilithrix luteola TaxID=1391654 RepID=A0A0K1QCE7_9BACT|nr:NAD-dependent epimerase/dehydratase family protein [Labilithrix luteola]AKV03105.1 UDP-glucose 4-epimerase [Labilithrix luteola]
MSGIQLVTGGAGYFGTLLVEALVKEGKKVRILDIHDADLPNGVEKIRADIRDAAAVERACEGVEVIHHNVALVPLAKDKEAFFAVNEGGTKNLLEAALKKKVRKVVSTSSSAVYGAPARNPVDDNTPTLPAEDYGKAKLAAEHLCHDYEKRGLDVTIIRPRTIMGHGRLGIMQILFEWIRQGRNIPVLGRGDNVYQFVHADDLASACLKAAERPGSTIYNVGAENFGTMRGLLESLVRHAGTGSRVVSVPSSPAVAMMKVTSRLGVSPLGAYHALMYGKSMHFDVSRTKRELDWSAKYSNEEMFADSYDWYIRHRDEVLHRRNASHHRSPVRQGVLSAVSVALNFAR